MKTSRAIRFGPGLLITAAFIGPGTVTTATLAGARFGYALLWALVFSVAATIVLQEMSARIGAVCRCGLGEAIRQSMRSRWARGASIVLVIAAIALGNAAYQMGNIQGAALGLGSLLPIPHRAWVLLVGGAAAALLATETYRAIQRVLVALVALMSIVFVVTATQVRPAWGELLHGAVVPTADGASLLTVTALIGTTVVPYNLFLHAAAVRDSLASDEPPESALRRVRWDAVMAISLGGLITGAIIVTAAAFFGRGEQFSTAGDMARHLEPVLGVAAKYFFALGLFAAGLTSAVTAPLAAAYATTGVLGIAGGLKNKYFRAVWVAIVIVGTTLAYFSLNPVQAIVFAQVANAVLLPIIAVLCLLMANRADLLGRYRNGWKANFAGAAVVLIATGLGAVQLLRACGWID
jgi:manganese transport protein